MSTSFLFAEILVIGIWSFLWLYAVSNKIFAGDIFVSLADADIFSSIIFVGFIYFLGMIMNVLSDIIFKPIDSKLATQSGGKENLQKGRAIIILKSEHAAQYLNQRRSIMRIFRANTLNLIFTFVAIIFLRNSVTKIFLVSAWTLGLLVFLLILFSAYAYYRTLKGYNVFITSTIEILDD